MQVHIKEYVQKKLLYPWEDKKSWANTKAKKRYLKAMEENPKAIILFRCGKFFEAFHSSAEQLHVVLHVPYTDEEFAHTSILSSHLYESLKQLRKRGRSSIRIV